MADGRLRPQLREWTPERVAQALVGQRDRLVDRLPREIAGARGLTRDQCELVIDEAIDYVVTEYDKPIPDRRSLDRAFWAAASFRVRRVHEGRGATVRAGWRRVDVADVDLPGEAAQPERSAVDRIERGMLLEFAATLTPVERDVLRCKYGGERELGRVVVARRLGMAATEVRRAERSIVRKLERFAAIVAAGSLCTHRAGAIFALAEGASAGAQEQAARIHLQHCGVCRAAYAEHVRAVRSGALQRRIGQLLPASSAEVGRRRGGPWEAAWDWLTHPFGHESAMSVAQITTASRGVGAALTAKLAALCLAGGAVVGGGAYCIGRLGDSPPTRVDRPPAHVEHEHTARERPLPTAGRSRALSIARPSRSRTEPTDSQPSEPTGRTASGGGAAETQHEREVPISPPATASSGAPVTEFDPGPADTAPSQPAAPPASGAPEFP